MRWFVALVLIYAGSAAAQSINYETEGNLAPTHRVGCVPLGEAENAWSPADLAQGVLACFKSRQDDAAVDLLILMNARGIFDQARVADRTAHQGLQVLSLQIGQAAGRKWEPRMQSAFQRFGGAGSERHKAMCRFLRSSGPPSHSPRYMIQHGMRAVLGQQGDGLVEGFSPDDEWRSVLSGYANCSGQ